MAADKSRNRKSVRDCTDETVVNVGNRILKNFIDVDPGGVVDGSALLVESRFGDQPEP